MHVVFRFDSGSKTGMGHLMRCLSLAHVLRRRSAALSFLCDRETRKALTHYWPAAHCLLLDSYLSEQQDAQQCLTHLARLPLRADWLIVDHYRLNKNWEMRLRGAADRIMRAVGQVLTSTSIRTRDLGGTASTLEYAEAVCRAIDRPSDSSGSHA